MKYNKLNFGCGNRFADNWENIDFHSEDSQVKRVNLLAGFPYVNESFEAVYSSHVLEHFDRAQGRFMINESYRVLRKGGVLRIVVPDLQGSCTEYLRILSLPEGAEKEKLYSWVIVELLDQMVRNVPGGEMAPLIKSLMAGDDNKLKGYVNSRIKTTNNSQTSESKFKDKLKKFTFNKLSTKISYLYLNAISYLIPKPLRSMVFVQTSIGEQHRWMYDEYSLRLLFKNVGFREIRRVEFNVSRIADFNSDHLDCYPDSKSYKASSIYLEGVK